jgi:hypothetical protein
MRRFLKLVQDDVKAGLADPKLADLAKPLGDAVRTLQETVMGVMQAAMRNPDEAGAAAADFLRLMGTVATGWMWLRMARVAQEKLAVGGAGALEPAFYEQKGRTARFFMAKLLPQVQALAASIKARRGRGDGAGARVRGGDGRGVTGAIPGTTRRRTWQHGHPRGCPCCSADAARVVGRPTCTTTSRCCGAIARDFGVPEARVAPRRDAHAGGYALGLFAVCRCRRGRAAALLVGSCGAGGGARRAPRARARRRSPRRVCSSAAERGPQVIIRMAAGLAGPDRRGRVVGTVVSGCSWASCWAAW